MINQQDLDPKKFSRYYKSLGPITQKKDFQAYTMLVLSFLAISFFGYFAIKPALATIFNLRRQIEDAKVVDQKLQEKITALSEAQANYEAIRPDMEIIMSALPEETKFAPFVKSLEKISTDTKNQISNLAFQSVDLSKKEATTTIEIKETPIKFSLSLAGTYPDMAECIKRLASFERILTLERIGFVTQGQSTPLQLNLIGSTYYVQ
jgi:Tfp pilus assembly protein PilO